MLDRYQKPLPASAEARLGFLREGNQEKPPPSPVASTDGALLATHHGRQIIVWDVAGGKVLRHLTPGVLNLQNLGFTDARTLVVHGRKATGFIDEVSVWDARTGEKLRSFETHQNHAGTALSRDGALLAVTTEGVPGGLKVWDVATGKHLVAVEESQPQVLFTHNGTLISYRQEPLRSGNYNTHITLRDARNGKEHRQLTLDDQRTWITDVSPDGKLWAGHTHVPNPVQDKERSQLTLFDAESGKPKRILLEQRLGTEVVFSPDGHSVAAADYSARGITVWNTADGKRVTTFPTSRYASFHKLRFSSDSKTLLHTSSGGVYLHDLTTQSTRNLNATHSFEVKSLTFSADGKRLAASSIGSELLIWDVGTTQLKSRCDLTRPDDATIHLGNLFARKLAFAPDDRHLLVQERNRPVRIVDPVNGRDVPAFREAGCVWAFSDDGRQLSWTAEPHDFSVRMHMQPPRVPGENKSPLLGIDRWLQAYLSSGDVRQFGYSSYVSPKFDEGKKKEEKPLAELFGPVSGAAAMPDDLSSDGNVLIETTVRLTGQPSSGMGTYWVHDGFRLSDTKTGREILRWKLPAQYVAIRVLPKGGGFISISRKGETSVLRLHDLKTGKETAVVSEAAGVSTPVAFSRDARYMAYATLKGTIAVYDLTAQREVRTFAAKEALSCFAFSPDGSILASGGHSGTILLWDVRSKDK
jgi:WD40 repeat protein